MMHKIYNRLITLGVVGVFLICLLTPTTTQAQYWQSCQGCNDENACTLDFCFLGHCFNLPLWNCATDCELDIYKVEVGNCYFDHSDYKSKAKLKVYVKWKNAPSYEDIKVSINGQEKTVNVVGRSGSSYAEFIVPADGSQNNGIWAKFKRTPRCSDEDKYKTPWPCAPPPVCDLDIYKVEVGECWYENGQSQAKLKVCVNWKNRPGSENIIVSINGQNKTIYPSTKDGNACVEFIVPANGTANNGIWAKFQYTTSCQDEDKYHTPYACIPPAPCDLDIYKVEVGECWYENGQSQAKLKVCVNWKNRPASENIIVSINGQNKTIYPSTKDGNACVEFIVPANGTANNGIWAKFQYTTSCQDEDKYHTPYACIPPAPCELDIYKVEVGECWYENGQSQAKLKVCVNWKNRPGSENIIVSINGQNKTIYPATKDGNACVEFIVPANGTANNGIWAKFQYTTSCQDEDKYHTPYACVPPPPCELDIYKVEVGECWYENGQSQAKLKVCVSWKNRPASENIIVSINGQNKTIYPSTKDGNACVEFIVPANGTANNGIWAKFQYTTSCQDEDKYHTPYACIPPPPCELDIYKVEVGECWYENGQSQAKLKVCVNWKNRPGSENIIVSINGQNKTIYPSTKDGNACVEFIVPANGTANNGIWAKFQYTTSCQDEDKYHTPYACVPPPPCELDIYKVEVSECWYENGQSQAKLKVCVNWKTVQAAKTLSFPSTVRIKPFIRPPRMAMLALSSSFRRMVLPIMAFGRSSSTRLPARMKINIIRLMLACRRRLVN
ncbi:MAG: hypothetical protein IPJ74_02965 [Saprospiraceae bacterium]|nr:hypothetical protein [Saprospiraceae bacterium]